MRDLQAFFARNAVPFWGTCRLEGELSDCLAPELAGKFASAIVFGFPLSNAVVDSLSGGPSPLYLHHYRQVNYLLDRTALQLALALEAGGASALPVPASQIVDWRNRRGHFCHRRAAAAAGLGWRGRNNLLVTPGYGSRVRLVSVLTDRVLPAGAPLACGCGDCQWCAGRCPAGAVGQKPADFDGRACFQWIKDTCRAGGIAQEICGLCLCPGPEKKRAGGRAG